MPIVAHQTPAVRHGLVPYPAHPPLPPRCMGLAATTRALLSSKELLSTNALASTRPQQAGVATLHLYKVGCHHGCESFTAQGDVLPKAVLAIQQSL